MLINERPIFEYVLSKLRFERTFVLLSKKNYFHHCTVYSFFVILVIAKTPYHLRNLVIGHKNEIFSVHIKMVLLIASVTFSCVVSSSFVSGKGYSLHKFCYNL